MTELKPCPFCGSDDCQMLPFGDQVYVHCNDCGGESGFDLTAEKAAEKWNRRTKKSAQVSVSQRRKKMVKKTSLFSSTKISPDLGGRSAEVIGDD